MRIKNKRNHRFQLLRLCYKYSFAHKRQSCINNVHPKNGKRESGYSLLPVMAMLCTKVRCVNTYRMISGMQQISTPMEISCC